MVDRLCAFHGAYASRRLFGPRDCLAEREVRMPAETRLARLAGFMAKRAMLRRRILFRPEDERCSPPGGRMATPPGRHPYRGATPRRDGWLRPTVRLDPARIEMSAP
jgi:hypothetical protein